MTWMKTGGIPMTGGHRSIGVINGDHPIGVASANQKWQWDICGQSMESKSIYIPYSKPSNFQASPRGAVPPELSPRGSAGSDTRGCLPPRRVVSLATLEAPPGCVRWDDQ